MYGYNLRGIEMIFSAAYLCWRDYKVCCKLEVTEPSSLHGKMCLHGPEMRNTEMKIELHRFGEIHTSHVQGAPKRLETNTVHFKTPPVIWPLVLTLEFSEYLGNARPQTVGV